TPTSTGFVAQFDADLDVATLNLYDTESGGLGAADATLVGTATGPVRGSLVVDPGLRKVTFVRTGGVLAPDAYALTLRSAATGFPSAGGPLPDGNGDGTAGDSYATTFPVAPSTAVVVGLPDFARGFGQAANVPASGTGLPLTLSDGAGVLSVDLT